MTRYTIETRYRTRLGRTKAQVDEVDVADEDDLVQTSRALAERLQKERPGVRVTGGQMKPIPPA